MAELDTQLAADAEAIAGLEARTEELEAAILTLDSRIAELDEREAELTAVIATLSAREADLASRVTRLRTRCEAQGGGADSAAGAAGGTASDAGEICLLHADHQGRPVQATDLAGAVAWRSSTVSPFGVTRIPVPLSLPGTS